MPKVHVKKGDTVLILSGEDAGRKGKVLEVRAKEGRVVVEGMNIIKRHERRNPRTNARGGIVDSPGPMASSKVMLVCPHCGKPTRARREASGEGRTRVCKACGREIE